MNEEIIIADGPIRLEDVLAIARGAKVRLSSSPDWRRKIERGRKVLEDAAASGRPIYGVNTGVGRSSRRSTGEAQSALQLNLLRMHGCGLGPHLSVEEARAVTASRLVCLAKGYSGVRPALLEALADLLNSGIAPAIPAFGSVGASGDLAPLSYLGALLAGERQAYAGGKLVSASEALAGAGLVPFAFGIKEGLALINGTCVMSGLGVLIAARARRVIDLGERASALALELVEGRSAAMHPTLHRIKPHEGQVASARRIRSHLRGSRFVRNGEPSNHEGREVQDRYSIRCAPQLLGAARDALSWAEKVLETEVNGVSDNPVVDPESGEILNGGNFYGGHVALAMDCLKVALGTVINLFDRQFAFFVSDANPKFGETMLPAAWLPAEEKGLHHGPKALQITLSSLTAMAQQRAFPDSLLSRQTECDNQDVVSMGTNAALSARAIQELVEFGLAAWLVALSQAAAIRGEDGLSAAGMALVDGVRRSAPVVEADRPLDADLRRILDDLILSVDPCLETERSS
jgi:histidine ammonia-lyase